MFVSYRKIEINIVVKKITMNALCITKKVNIFGLFPINSLTIYIFYQKNIYEIKHTYTY